MVATDIPRPGRLASRWNAFVKHGFGSPGAIVISVVIFAGLGYLAWSFLGWAVFNAV